MRPIVASLLALLLAACASSPPRMSSADLAAEVRAAEVAFAQSMADRDFAAFSSFVADDAVFVNGGKPVRGKAAILADWQKFFAEPAAPFSWKPETAEVAGDVGYTEGPVTSPAGKVFARFHTTWRRDGNGRWHVVFDNGHPACDCPK